MPRERLARVLDMLENARRAAKLVSGRAREDLDSDLMLALDLERAVEIIGEAARFVPDDLRNRYPDIPWRAIAGTRDKLIHGYSAWTMTCSGRSPRLSWKVSSSN